MAQVHISIYKDADYTIKYYKDSVSDANYLGECTRPGTVDEVITVPAGSDIGQLDYKKPVGYRSGVLQDTNVKVKADNSSVVRVVYPADTVEYTVEAYIMGTDGQYPASPTKTEKKPDLTNKEVSAPTDTAYWVGDAEEDAFTFDSANENNVISGTVAGDNSTVLKVYISRNQYTLTWDVTKDDDTTYKVGDTTKYYYGQAVTEPKVEVPDYYDFDNWEKGGVDWPDTMPKNDVNISGELIRQRTDLVISKSGMEQGESAIFTVTGKGLGSGMKVIVPSGESVKIKNLPALLLSFHGFRRGSNGHFILKRLFVNGGQFVAKINPALGPAADRAPGLRIRICSPAYFTNNLTHKAPPEWIYKAFSCFD